MTRHGTVLVGWALVVALLALPASTESPARPGAGDGDGDHLIGGCTPEREDGWSVARVWDEALLDAIRRDVPAPTVHGRNLFHVSAAMWDAWAAYDPEADGYFVDQKHTTGGADDVEAAREAAISYAAYRILLHRYSLASGMEATFEHLAATMEALCYRIDYVDTTGSSPAALGNRIAATVIDQGRDDGSLEAQRYVDTDYRPTNPPLVVTERGATMTDPNRWQPLALAQLVAQNGLPLPGNVQGFVGPHWGHVRSFALPGSDDGLPADPGPPPLLDDEADSDVFQQAAVEVIRASSQLDPADGEIVDISPTAWGDSPLGTNDGDGHDHNPDTGEPYAPNPVLRGDFARALAEFWADGPQSETPPGHWNTIANTVSDAPDVEHRIGGEGPTVDRLEWDVKLYLALNGAVHDAAVAAWGVKGFYDSARPISMIRYLGGRGQSSDPAGPSYDPDGLPLVPGLVEVVTPESSAPGQRHESLADHQGEVAVRSWRGNPEDRSTTSGVGWVLATRWVPYQRETFVTPAFAGYVSGHSTFSRAAAEVLTSITGDAYFPGGLSEWTVEADALTFERGPSRPVTFQWATYYDAADHAGISRVFGGIHITADDYAGRTMGSACGEDAWHLALEYYAGTATPNQGAS
ncbi:MAG: vanadium-dependent haloperoxidase [Acidimicrobiales bacterium]